MNKRFRKKTSVTTAATINSRDDANLDVSNTVINESATFKQISQLIQIYQSQSKDPDTLLEKILRVVKGHFNADQVYLWKSCQDKKEAHCKKSVGQGTNSNQLPIALTQAPFSELLNSVESMQNQGALYLSLKYDNDFYGFLELKTSNAIDSFDTKAIGSFDLAKELLATLLFTNDGYAHQQKLNERINILYDLHQEFSETMDLDVLLKKILNRSIDLLGADVGSIWLKSEQDQSIQCHIAHGPSKAKIEGVSIEKGVGIIGWVVENNQPSIIADCKNDVRFTSSIDDKTNYKTISMISAPLSVKGECLGSIQIINKKNNDLFTQSDLDFLNLIASESAMYIKNSRLFASEKHAKELKALINISKEVSSTLDFDSVLMSIANLSSDIINYDLAILSSFRPESNSLSVRAISGIQQIDQDDPDVKIQQQLHEQILSVNKEVTVKNKSDRDAYAAELPLLIKYMEESELVSFWAYVMTDDQGPLGIMTMESTNENMVQDDDKEMMSILLSQSTISMRNAQLYNTIPSGKVFSHLRDNLLDSLVNIKRWSLKKKLCLSGGILALFFTLIFVKLPNQVATNVEVIPISQTYYANAPGIIKSVHVVPGQSVVQGDLLIQLDKSDLLIELAQKQSQRQKAIYEMVKMQLDDRIADYKIKESEVLSLNYEIQLTQRKLAGTKITAKANGKVLTEDLHELQGMPVNFGQELIAISYTDRVHIKFDVPEEQAPFVRPGQKIKFKLFGYPTTDFSKNLKLITVAAEGRKLTEQDSQRYFIATTEVSTADYHETPLRPGMTGRGKIETDARPIGMLIFEAPIRLLMTEFIF